MHGPRSERGEHTRFGVRVNGERLFSVYDNRFAKQSANYFDHERPVNIGWNWTLRFKVKIVVDNNRFMTDSLCVSGKQEPRTPRPRR